VGGLFLEREQCWHTPGVFFRLARNRMTKLRPGKVFANSVPGMKPITQVFDLPETLPVLTHHYGKASTVKITLIGHPTQVVERGDVVIVGFLNDTLIALPQSLPTPLEQTKYLVLVVKKQ
jgi:hypothetical protein